MKYLLVVYFLIGGEWISGADMEGRGWSPMPYATMEKCLASKTRAEAIQVNLKIVNPRAFDKRFACEPRETSSGD